MFQQKSTIKNGVVYLFFTDEFSAYLVGRPIAKYPHSLFRINGKMHNAYSIGFKMALHASNRNNIRKGTSRTLSVKNLLKCTDYPSYGQWQSKEITATKAMELLSLKPNTFYRLVSSFKKEH